MQVKNKEMYWTICWTMYVFIKNQTNMKLYKEKFLTYRVAITILLKFSI